jgi:hypothetical protein
MVALCTFCVLKHNVFTMNSITDPAFHQALPSLQRSLGVGDAIAKQLEMVEKLKIEFNKTASQTDKSVSTQYSSMPLSSVETLSVDNQHIVG